MKSFVRFWLKAFAYVAGYTTGLFVGSAGLIAKAQGAWNEFETGELRRSRRENWDTHVDPQVRGLQDRYEFGPVMATACRDTKAKDASELVGFMKHSAIQIFRDEYADGNQLNNVRVEANHARAGRVIHVRGGFVFQDVPDDATKFSIEMPLCEARRLKCLDQAMKWVLN